MNNELIIPLLVFTLSVGLVASACGTRPGEEQEQAVILEAIEEGEDPLDAMYRANMTSSAGKRASARILLEIAKQLRDQNRLLAEIRDELHGLQER